MFYNRFKLFKNILSIVIIQPTHKVKLYKFSCLELLYIDGPEVYQSQYISLVFLLDISYFAFLFFWVPQTAITYIYTGNEFMRKNFFLFPTRFIDYINTDKTGNGREERKEEK